MKILKRLIILLSISIILLIIIGIVINRKGEDNGFNTLSEGEPAEEYNYVHEVDSRVDFYSVSNCIETYLNYIFYRNAEAVYSLLDKEYININSINEENVLSKLESYYDYQMFDAKQMYSIKNENDISCFLVIGNSVGREEYGIKGGDEYKAIVKVDNQTKAYSIIPYKENIDKDYLLKINKDKIQKNQFNNFKAIVVKDIDMCSKLFWSYRCNVFTDVESAYDLLDKQYREKRFENLENYKKYIEKNSIEIPKMQMTEYLVNTYDEYTEYVCKDQYGNLYIFKETAVMQYTLTLDTYTLENEKFTTTYEQSNDQKKVMMNVDKFFQMLNARDYKTSYEILDSGFKNNYFNTQEVYENYMRSAFPDHYKVEYTGFSNEGNILIQKVKLTSMENNTTMEKNIIMKLEEGTKFVMSFNIQ